MRTKFLVLGLVCLFIFGGATALVSKKKVKDITVEAPFNETWQAVIESFADMNAPIKKKEKNSGRITTDWIEYPMGEGKKYSKCSVISPEEEIKREGKFKVSVKSITDSSCKIKVKCTFRLTYDKFDTAGRQLQLTRKCSSKGKLEADMFELIKAKVGK